MSPELEEPSESLSPLLPLSDPGPWCLPKLRRTKVGELSLEVVSGALLSMLAMPAMGANSKFPVYIAENGTESCLHYREHRSESIYITGNMSPNPVDKLVNTSLSPVSMTKNMDLSPVYIKGHTDLS